MAGSTRRTAGSATLEKPSAGYDRDFYWWAQEQGRLLRAGRWSEVDRENVAEEIESLGREQFNKLESAIRVLLIHMLKWDYQPDRRSRSWALSIKEQRIVLRNLIDDNPGLEPRINEAVTRAYEQARVAAANETGISDRVFPHVSPFSFADITSRPFEYE